MLRKVGHFVATAALHRSQPSQDSRVLSEALGRYVLGGLAAPAQGDAIEYSVRPPLDR